MSHNDMGVYSIPLASVGHICMTVSGLEAEGAAGLRTEPTSDAFGVRDVRGCPRYGLRESQGMFQHRVTGCVYILLSFWSLSRSQGLTVC